MVVVVVVLQSTLFVNKIFPCIRLTYQCLMFVQFRSSFRIDKSTICQKEKHFETRSFFLHLMVYVIVTGEVDVIRQSITHLQFENDVIVR